MNLMQTLPAPSPSNTRILEYSHDFGNAFDVTAVYDAGGPRFRQSAAIRGDGKSALTGVACGGAISAAVNDVNQAIADHLAAINPTNND